ncbi:hypothetical protein Tco_0718217 [Tanacetum coccineum]
MVNELSTVELERYKERVGIFEQRQEVDLHKREKLIDSLMDDLIRKRNAKFVAFQQEIDTPKETLSTHLNKIKEDFGKYFVTQKELSAEQAFWLKHLSISETPVKSHTPVRIKAPSELPKVCLVNESLKRLKFQLANFDKVVKKRLTSDAITAVQTVFNQMKAAVDQCFVDKNAFEIQIKQLQIDNDQFLNQIMSKEIVHIAVNSVDILDVNMSCVEECSKCLELETELMKKKDFIENDVYDQLVKSYSTLEKHCISLELATQLNQEILQKDNFGLKDRIKYLIRKENVENVKKDIDELETINIELEHSVAKLLSENENLRKERAHLKLIYKDQFDSIKKIRIQSKEQNDSLIAQINANSIENSDLNAQIQEKIFAITTLKNELRKLKGKNVVDTVVSKPSTVTVAPGMFKINLEPLAPKLLQNKDAYIDYIKHSRDHADTL